MVDVSSGPQHLGRVALIYLGWLCVFSFHAVTLSVDFHVPSSDSEEEREAGYVTTRVLSVRNSSIIQQSLELDMPWWSVLQITSQNSVSTLGLRTWLFHPIFAVPCKYQKSIPSDAHLQHSSSTPCSSTGKQRVAARSSKGLPGQRHKLNVCCSGFGYTRAPLYYCAAIRHAAGGATELMEYQSRIY